MSLDETAAVIDRPGRLPRQAARTEWMRIASDLEDICSQGKPGDRIPTHTELMRRLDASERTVLRALTELQRRGRIERRHGSGTYITHRSASPALKASGQAATNESGAIVAFAQPDQSFFDLCMNLLYGHARDAGLELVCRFIPNETDIASINVGADDQRGFIFFNYKMQPLAKRLQDVGHRVVIVGTPPVDAMPDVPCVYGDQEQGGYLAAKHMIQLGHDRLGYFHTTDDLYIQRRGVGHLRAVGEAKRSGRVVDTVYISLAQFQSWSADPSIAAAYFRGRGAPTGIVAWNDHEAAGLLSLFSRAGIKTPDDLSLIGYDALPMGEVVTPALTTIDGGVQHQLAAAVRLLTQAAAPPSASTVIVLPQLIQRGSATANISKRNMEQ